jgi:hypothetical protein
MWTRAHPRTSPPQQLWSGRIWPPLAGAVTAVGVFAASNALGVLVLAAMYVALSMFAVTMVWGLSLEMGIRLSSAVRCGLYAALTVVVAVGLCEVHPQYGLLVGIAVALSSPAALGLLAKVRPRSTSHQPDRTARPAPAALVDKALLHRRFDDIVSRLKDLGDFPEN